VRRYWEKPSSLIKHRAQRSMNMRLKALLTSLWYFIRDASGENDYRRYRERARARGESPISSAGFYLSRLEHKYSRPNRCC
jgi:Selenoprotein, putative